MRVEIGKNLFFAVLIVCITLFFIVFLNIEAKADTVYMPNGEVTKASVKVWPESFTNKTDAERVALTLQNGDVYRDQDTGKYIIVYGSIHITDVVLISNME